MLFGRDGYPPRWLLPYWRARKGIRGEVSTQNQDVLDVTLQT